MKGKIKFFKTDRGFGFIKTADGDYFFHVSTARSAGLNDDQLKEGAEFEIEIGKDKKGKMSVTKFVTNNPTPTPVRSHDQNKPRCNKSATNSRNLLSYTGNDRNFYLFLNKPYHVREHDKMVKGEFKLEPRTEELERFSFLGVDCAAITKRHKDNVNILFSDNVKSVKARIDWRLTLGLGGASVFETDITLHHTYGVPYVPASSIKGVVRSYIIEEEFDSDEAAAIMDKNFCDIFGCSKEHEIHVKGDDGKVRKTKEPSWYGKNMKKKPERRGAIHFFDAFPTETKDIQISMDIMNVHYKDYYDAVKKDGKYKEGKVKPPADWSNPTIINFLTVKKATFQFLVASKNDSLTTLKIQEKTIDEWLAEALENHGIGAKTAVGYGYMS